MTAKDLDREQLKRALMNIGLSAQEANEQFDLMVERMEQTATDAAALFNQNSIDDLIEFFPYLRRGTVDDICKKLNIDQE